MFTFLQALREGLGSSGHKAGKRQLARGWGLALQGRFEEKEFDSMNRDSE